VGRFPVPQASKGAKPHEGSRFGGSRSRVKLCSGVKVHERMSGCFARPIQGAVGKTSKVGSQDQDHRGRVQPVGPYRLFQEYSEGQTNRTRGGSARSDGCVPARGMTQALEREIEDRFSPA
jgi:hypothetical protein